MHVVAIAWLFVAILMAAAETSMTAAVLTFFLYGLAPLALFWWIVGTPRRRARRLRDVHERSSPLRQREAAPGPNDGSSLNLRLREDDAIRDSLAVDQLARQPDQKHAEPDQ
jgi:hypothetical protein